MSERTPPPPPADALVEGVAIGKKEARAMLMADVRLFNEMDEHRVVIIAKFIRMVVEGRGRPLDEARVNLIRGLVEAVFKNRDLDLIHTLAEVNRLTSDSLFGPKVDKTLGRKAGK